MKSRALHRRRENWDGVRFVTPLANQDKREYGHRCDQQDGEYDGPNQRMKRSRVFLIRRVMDGVIRRMIDKWLKAGILEDGVVVIGATPAAIPSRTPPLRPRASARNDGARGAPLCGGRRRWWLRWSRGRRLRWPWRQHETTHLVWPCATREAAPGIIRRHSRWFPVSRERRHEHTLITTHGTVS